MDREAADIDGRQEEKWRAKRIKSGTKGKGKGSKRERTRQEKRKGQLPHGVNGDMDGGEQ